MLPKLRRLLKGFLILISIGLLVLFLLRWRGLLLLPNQRSPKPWNAWGVDVSAYQGEVDWQELAQQGVQFAFIKATEGSGSTDRYFLQNWARAQDAGVWAGAYHFFSYDSPGETQAKNFIDLVPLTPGMLPPVVDIEFYGDKLQNPPSQEEVEAILKPLLAGLEEYYGQKPILYATYRSYRLYLEEGYEEYPLWITRPLFAPIDKNWAFWQYSHSAHLSGYEGREEHIDLNVFQGTLEELDLLRKK
ncbi:MAG: glycosyl hydrolase family 25 [Oscillospiraceae bacterium]|nr:glycosyl hydrolase family 25 [Oscillospiraceae bacterium]